MAEVVESALQQHHHHHHDTTKQPTRHLIKRRLSGRVLVVSSGTKRVALVVPLASTKINPAITVTTTPAERSNSSNIKVQSTQAIENDNTANRKAITSPPSSVATAATSQPPGLSRTQQKLLLQRQQCLVEDETTMIHPNNMRRLTHELDRVGREYRSVKQFQDPMRLSLERCTMKQGQHASISDAAPAPATPAPTAAAVHRGHLELKAHQQQKNRPDALDGEDKRSMRRSSSAAAAATAAAASRPLIRWSAGAFLDRVLCNGSNFQ